MSGGVLTCPLGSQEVPGVPYSLHVLQEGHSSLSPDGSCRAEGSISLVWGGPVTALVDTGGPWGRGHLLQLLAAQGLCPEDVTHVVVTHGHSDHVGNINLFPEATLVVGMDLSLKDGLYLPHGMARGQPYVLHPGHLEVVPTPGHTLDHVSLLLRGTSLGTVLVAGDLFESEEDEEVWRSLSQDQAQQERSRSWALGIADVIVPGHGAAFRVCRQGGAGGEGWQGAAGGDASDGGRAEGHGRGTSRGGAVGGRAKEEEDGTGGDLRP